MNIRMVSTGYSNSRGLPFQWYKWSDFGGQDRYNWWAIPGNIVTGLAAAIVVGLLVDKLTPKPVEPFGIKKPNKPRHDNPS